MVKSWSSTLSRCSVFVFRDLVTSGVFFAKELQEEEDVQYGFEELEEFIKRANFVVMSENKNCSVIISANVALAETLAVFFVIKIQKHTQSLHRY